jgi:soluble lytic murein transglycosylase-like protein
MPARKALTAAAPLPLWQSVFEKEQAITPAQLLKRWKPMVAKASRRFGIPITWINAVMRLESGGRTMLSERMLARGQPMWVRERIARG